MTYEEALLQKRLECVKRLKGQLDVENSIAAEAIALYTSVVEGKKSAINRTDIQ